MGNCLTAESKIGYRNPDTSCGSKCGAYIIILRKKHPKSASFFWNGWGFNSYPSAEQVKNDIQVLIKRGWKPMTRKDIRATRKL